MAQLQLKVKAGNDQKERALDAKSWFGTNLGPHLHTRENFINLMSLVTLGFKDELNLARPFNQIILVEQINRDQYDRIKETVCKAYFFREEKYRDEKSCMIIEIGKKDGVGSLVLYSQIKLKELYNRAKSNQAIWNTSLYCVDEIRLRGKQNSAIFYDRFAKIGSQSVANLVKYFLNDNFK